ncbi:MAG: hypothetical protein IJB97_08530, partial [Clostridia bacterium]|nr:hypothetical protein [Clostridia bacterium]
MKRKYIVTLLLTWLVAVVLATFGVACGGTITLDRAELAMNLYDEVQLNVEGAADVAWSSSDKNIVTVTEDGLVIAQGVRGDATVTAKSGGASATCKIRVRDWEIYPVLKSSETRAFVGSLTDPIVCVSYADKDYAPDSVTYTSQDEGIATVENGQVKGVAVGETELTVSAVWKKKTVTGTVQIAVYPAESLILKETTADVYDVPDGTVAKSNVYRVEAELFKTGVKQENATFTLEALTNPDYVTIDGMDVKVAKTPDTDGVEVQIAVRNDQTGVALEEILTLTVRPNYIVMDGMKELVDTKSAKIALKLHEDSVGGRTNVVDYTIENVKENAHATAANWANWNTRIEFASTQTLNGHSAYDSIKKAGYRMISADIYYTGENGMFFGSNGSSSYFYTNVRNNRTDIVLVNQSGEITNTLISGEWMTVYYDLDRIIVDTTVAGKDDCNIFLSCNYLNDTCYIDNVRYWFDTTELDKFDVMIDVAERNLTPATDNAAKAIAPENEFIEYSPIYVSFAESELDGVACYQYDSANAPTYDAERRSKINAYNDLNGMAVKKGYRYITFDIYVESGAPYFKFFELYSQKELTVKLTDGTVAPARGARFFKDGAAVDTFTQGGWVTVAIRIDGKAKETFFITSTTASKFYLKNVCYYQDESFEYEYGERTSLTAKADHVDSAYYVNDTIDVRALLDVRLKGQKITDFAVDSVTVADETVAAAENGKISVNAYGKSKVTVSVSKDGYTATVTFTLRVLADSRVELVSAPTELYCGEKDLFEKRFTVLARGYENKTLLDASKLKITVVSGEENIAVDGLTLSGKKSGTATLKVGFESADGAFVGEEFTVTVFDAFRQRSNDEFVWGNRDNTAITYGAAEETVGGRTGAYRYYSETSNSWNDRLMIYE